jgi:hypothetical protein
VPGLLQPLVLGVLRLQVRINYFRSFSNIVAKTFMPERIASSSSSVRVWTRRSTSGR